MDRTSEDMRGAAQFFRILGDEARLQMLWLLFNHAELCVCDFVTALAITQSKASRHLRTLWHAGLVTDRKEGLWSYYSLRPLESELLRSHLQVLRSALAKCPEAQSLLESVRCCLEANRTPLALAGLSPERGTPALSARRAERPAGGRRRPRPGRGPARPGRDEKPATGTR